MIEIKRENDDIVVRFPKDLITNDELERFLARLRIEEFAQKSKMTEEQAWELSEEIKQKWWDENKEWIYKKIGKEE